ncbi:MAG: hydantoinase/oxoprolinase family protein [Halobacteriales archaeon]|nr:hydantoinase/oxoprolinase family protein [Halobacteriales archaeon]
MTYRLGVDIGGTFTDIVLYDVEADRVHTTKTPSTPDAFDEGVIDGVEKAGERYGVAGGDVSFLSHGTTVGTNAVLEEELPTVGLVTNDGLRDVLEIGDQTRPELYDLFTDKPPSIVPRHLRTEVPGRLANDGSEIRPLDEDRARVAVEALVEEGVESIVVSMLYSYLNDDHERLVGEVIEEAAPETPYALSSAVYPEVREYERTITTVLNEAVKVAIRDYIDDLESELGALDIDAPLNIMHSGGGLLRADQATRDAIRTVLSGPAAGAVATRHTSGREGFPNAIGMDMGGTSTDVSIVRDGEIVRTTEGEINDLPIKTPMIDLSTVGAGGGSITWVDDGGALRVGPQSAGADPGPICYGRGGERATTTDANLLLGRIDPDHFLGGDLTLEVEETRRRFEAQIAEPLGQSVPEAAQSVVNVANARLTREIRRVTVERGEDPGGYALVAFGGAGPMHAVPVAEAMDMEGVLVPRNPGVFSATGLLVADVRVDASHSYRASGLDPDTLTDQFAGLVEQVTDRLRQQGFADDEFAIERTVDCRYVGQSYELAVEVPGAPTDPVDAPAVEAIEEGFHERHRRMYGHARRSESVEAVILRVAGRGDSPSYEPAAATASADPTRESRDVHFDGTGFVETSVVDRPALAPGATVEGPAILEEASATTVVPPGATAEVTDRGNVLIR